MSLKNKQVASFFKKNKCIQGFSERSTFIYCRYCVHSRDATILVHLFVHFESKTFEKGFLHRPFVCKQLSISAICCFIVRNGLATQMANYVYSAALKNRAFMATRIFCVLLAEYYGKRVTKIAASSANHRPQY